MNNNTSHGKIREGLLRNSRLQRDGKIAYRVPTYENYDGVQLKRFFVGTYDDDIEGMTPREKFESVKAMSGIKFPLQSTSVEDLEEEKIRLSVPVSPNQNY